MAEERRAGPGRAAFFDAHQRQTVEAAMARIIPTDDQPGAREAGTVEFLDRYLSGLGYVYAQPDGSGFEKLEGSGRRPGSSASTLSATSTSRASWSSTAGAGNNSVPSS
jgi:hypothetical protein